MAGLYLHIPFCKSRCIYCGFYSTSTLEMRERYVDAICHEIRLRKEYLSQIQSDHAKSVNVLSTIYLGGGTPSQLTQTQLLKIFATIADVFFNGNQDLIKKNCEVTIECNPDDVNESFAKFIGRTPVNRVSMGVQSFSDERLTFLHRRHHVREVYNATYLLRQEGIKNISIDLIFGFPNETLSEWKNDIDKAIQLDVQHISAYSLMYEKGTPLYKMLESKEVDEVDEELSLSMYQELVKELKQAGYEHYEISNFAKTGFRSQHNSSYWQGIPYFGVGASAHSYNIGSRQWNISNITKYISAIEKNEIPFEIEMLDDNTRYNDTITTALRTCDGIHLSSISPKYRSYLLEQAQKAISQNLLEIQDNHIRLTERGIFVSDDVMSDLIFV